MENIIFIERHKQQRFPLTFNQPTVKPLYSRTHLQSPASHREVDGSGKRVEGRDAEAVEGGVGGWRRAWDDVLVCLFVFFKIILK